MSEKDTGKFKFTESGVFVSWPVVVTLLVLVMGSGLVPLWLFAVKAFSVAENVEALVENDKQQNKELAEVKTEVAVLKERVK